MAASEKRLTSMRRLSSRPGTQACCQDSSSSDSPDHEIHQLAGDDDLLDDLLAVDMAPDGGVGASKFHQLLSRRVRGCLDACAALAVDLDDEGEYVAGEQRGV